LLSASGLFLLSKALFGDASKDSALLRFRTRQLYSFKGTVRVTSSAKDSSSNGAIYG